MITIFTERCWRLVTPDGMDYDRGDGAQHFDAERQAQEFARLDDRPDLTARQYDTPCVTVTCDDCGEGPEDDVYDTIHFHDEADARRGLDAYGFTADPAPGRRVRCEGCEESR